MRTHGHIYGLIILLLSALAFTLSCNLDGPGIFYSINQQVKLNESDISELKIHQVLEVSGTVYARSGTKVWKYKGDNSWDEIASGNTGSITSDGTDLYGLFYDEDLSGSSIEKYDGSSWNDVGDPFDSDGVIFNAGDAGVVCYNKSDYKTETTTDFSTFFTESSLAGDLVFDGAKEGANYYVISKTKVYSGALDSLDDTNTPTEASGNFSAIAGDTTNNNIFLATDEGEVLYTSDDGATWNALGDGTGDEVPTSMAVVKIDIDGTPTDFLIIGTKNGYMEAKISGDLADASISSPTASTTADTDSFSSVYPSLADAFIFDIQAGTQGVFYLATEEGLWKRDPDNDPMFDKM